MGFQLNYFYSTCIHKKYDKSCKKVIFTKKCSYNPFALSPRYVTTVFPDVRDWRPAETWNTYQNFGVGQVHLLLKPNP